MSATPETRGQLARPDFQAAECGTDIEPDMLHSVIIRAERDQEIFGQAEPAQHCYLVVEGCVRLVSLMEDGRRQVSEFLMPGDLFGWEALETYDFSAEAVTSVVLRRYRRSSLEEHAESNRHLARRLRAFSAGQLRAARERMVLLGRKTAAERIASFLLEMARRLHSQSQIYLPMNRGDIADHLGLTTETVCRGLTKLRREGTIAVEGGHLAIRDHHALGLAGGIASH